jgi:hypothetical protein
VVVPRQLAAKDLVKILDGGNPTVLPAWDPMVCPRSGFLGGYELTFLCRVRLLECSRCEPELGWVFSYMICMGAGVNAIRFC